jgi:hypothetical protein
VILIIGVVVMLVMFYFLWRVYTWYSLGPADESFAARVAIGKDIETIGKEAAKQALYDEISHR